MSKSAINLKYIFHHEDYADDVIKKFEKFPTKYNSKLI